MNQFWKDSKAGIDYEGFLRIFKRYQIRVSDEDRKKKAGKYVPVTETILKKKKDIFDEINSVLKQERKDVRFLFNKIDNDGCKNLTQDEFFSMFKGMGIKHISREESNAIFSSMDFDSCGEISLPEFQADFNRVVHSSLDKLMFEARQFAKIAKADEDDREIDFNVAFKDSDKEKIKVDRLRTKVEILNAKIQQMQNREERRNEIVFNYQRNEQLND